MSIRTLFKGLFGPIKALDDPVLGSVIAVDRLPEGKLYWETKNPIPVGSTSVLVVFVADRSGPSIEQINHWIMFQSHQTELCEEARSFIGSRTNDASQELTIAQLRPTLVSLPEARDGFQEWTLMLATADDELSFDVVLAGGQPIRLD